MSDVLAKSCVDCALCAGNDEPPRKVLGMEGPLGFCEWTPEGWPAWAWRDVVRHRANSGPFNDPRPARYRGDGIRCGGWKAKRSDGIVIFRTYEATMRTREIPGREIRPEALAAEGKRYRFIASWIIGEDERSEYAGEIAMMFDYDADQEAPRIAWVASGDLTDITPVA